MMLGRLFPFSLDDLARDPFTKEKIRHASSGCDTVGG